MKEEYKVVQGSLAWIVGLALLGIVTARLIDPGEAAVPQERTGAEDTHHSG